MIADLLFSVGITVLAVGVYLLLDVRCIPRRRVEDLVKRLSPGRARDDWGYRLQSFGDVVWAFADAMNRESASASPAIAGVLRNRKRNLHHAGDVIIAPVALERGPALTSSQVR